MADAARCLVFGGSGALGGAVCEALAADGARLVLTYHAREGVARALAARLPEASTTAVDLASVASVEAAVDEAAARLGGIDAFVQCAGVAVTSPGAHRPSHPAIAEVDERGWDTMLAVNARSTFFAVRRVTDVMRGHGGGNVVVVGSIDGVKPVPAPVHYAASKGALGGMTAALAKELGPHNIRVNLVAPGIMEGGISRVLDAALMKEYLKHCGLRRLGRLGEVASVVAWLARHNTYVTGRTIVVDGAL
jgi:NAD(P)-dependent dehydrogenase (short-subunit alcohol dehydrogenase family)